MVTPDERDSRALDRQIAERLGYRRNGDLWEYDHPSLILAIVEDVPEYSTDLNAAITLLKQGFSVQIIPYADGTFGVYLEHLRTEKTYQETSASIAEAICRAFLAYTAASDH